MALGEPRFLGIEVTRRCNLRCPHCFTSSGGESADPSTLQLFELLSALAKAGVRSVAFSGGEPLTRQDIPDLVKHARQTGIEHIGLVTNGFHANASLARTLYEAGLRTVQVSVDGVDAIDHAAVRACNLGDYYRALRAIRVFMEVGLDVYVATIISPRNVERAPEMVLFCEALGLRGLRYCTFVPTGRAKDPRVAQRFAVDHLRLDEFLAFLRQLNQRQGAHLQVSVDHSIGPWLSDGSFQCESGKGVSYISASGELFPCPALMFDGFGVGNVYESPVHELLQSPKLSVVRYLTRNQIDGHCGTCSNQRCSGGCRGLAYALTSRIEGAVPYCNFDRTHSSNPPCDP